MAVHRKVQELTGYEMFLFRPPYGDYDNDVINVAKKCGYYSIYTAQALDTLITTLKDQWYEFVPISQLIYRDNYHMNHEGRQISS